VKELTVHIEKMLVAALAVGTSGCVGSLFAARFPSQVNVQAVYMDEGPNKNPPPPISCIKTWMPRTVKLSVEKMKAVENTYVSWVFVNECDGKGAPDATITLSKWALGGPLEPQAKHPKQRLGTPIAPPFDADCADLPTRKTIVPYHGVATVTCRLAKKDAATGKDLQKGEYYYAVVLQIGSYIENRDPIIYIDE
jgi:hypothetical protein